MSPLLPAEVEDEGSDAPVGDEGGEHHFFDNIDLDQEPEEHVERHQVWFGLCFLSVFEVVFVNDVFECVSG